MNDIQLSRDVPDGYELIPVGDRITADTLVYLYGQGWVVFGQPLAESEIIQSDTKGGYLPYRFYCRPIIKENTTS